MNRVEGSVALSVLLRAGPLQSKGDQDTILMETVPMGAEAVSNE